MRRACTARPSRMSIVAASTFAPVATRGVTLGRRSNDRASATRLARPAVTARAQAKADVAKGDVAVSRRAGLAAASGLAIAGLATRPARAIGGAAVGLPDVVELTPDNFAKQVRPRTTNPPIDRRSSPLRLFIDDRSLKPNAYQTLTDDPPSSLTPIVNS